MGGPSGFAAAARQRGIGKAGAHSLRHLSGAGTGNRILRKFKRGGMALLLAAGLIGLLCQIVQLPRRGNRQRGQIGGRALPRCQRLQGRTQISGAAGVKLARGAQMLGRVVLTQPGQQHGKGRGLILGAGIAQPRQARGRQDQRIRIGARPSQPVQDLRKIAQSLLRLGVAPGQIGSMNEAKGQIRPKGLRKYTVNTAYIPRCRIHYCDGTPTCGARKIVGRLRIGPGKVPMPSSGCTGVTQRAVALASIKGITAVP